jgi:hypothetical protein
MARQRWLAAAMLAGLAVATRSSGIVLWPVLLWELWRCRPPRRFPIEAALLSILATSGLWLYTLYLGAAFGHPLAFADGQAAFHANTTLSARLVAALTLRPFSTLNLTDIRPAGLDQWATLLFIALIAVSWLTAMDRGMTLFAGLVLLLPYLTLCGGPAGFTSMARFNIVSFPLFIAMAILTERRPWAVPAIVGIFGSLLSIYAALFGQWQWVG